MRVFVHRTGTGITQIQRRRVTSRHAPTTRDAAPGPERGVPRRKPWIGDGQWEESTVPLYNGFCDTPRQKAKKGTLQAYTQTCIHAYSKMIKKKYIQTLRLKRLVSRPNLTFALYPEGTRTRTKQSPAIGRRGTGSSYLPCCCTLASVAHHAMPDLHDLQRACPPLPIQPGSKSTGTCTVLY